MDALRRVQDQSRQAAFLFAAVAIVLLVIGLDRLTRRFVHEPLRAVLGTMAHASAGDLAARAPRVRQDEIGAVAEGLNGLLERMGGFNETLRSEVARATEELRASNEALCATAQRLFDARRELAQGQRLALAGHMAASVAHQVGTPLNVISGYVQLLKAKQDAGSADAARLSTIQEQIARVTTTGQSSLDRTRRPALSLRPLAPGELVTGLAELVRPSLVGHGIELSLEVAPGLPRVGADRAQLEQALLNLVSNAVDAMPSGGRLDAGGATPRRRVSPWIVERTRATGSWPRTCRACSTRSTPPSRPARGTGLGLPILREVVEAHGGSVELESRPGEGTTALVFAGRRGRRREMPRILVVDDDPETCRLMNELLREPEREIEMAESPSRRSHGSPTAASISWSPTST